MEESKYNILYLNKNSMCSTKTAKNEEIEKEGTNRKSSGDLSNFITGIPKQINQTIKSREPISIIKKDIFPKVIDDKSKSQVSKFGSQTFLNTVSSKQLDFQSLTVIVFKFVLCILDFMIDIFLNESVHNILAVIFTVSIEVFVVLVFAVSTILSAIIINIDDAYKKKYEFKHQKISLVELTKGVNQDGTTKLKTESVEKSKSSASINFEKLNKSIIAEPTAVSNSELISYKQSPSKIETFKTITYEIPN